MIPLMRSEIVERRQWLDEEQFVEQMSLAQAMPGVFAVNMATAIGYGRRGVWGAVAAILGAITVPIAILLLLAMCFTRLRGNSTVEHIFLGIRPAVVALIAAPVFNMAKVARISWSNVWIPLAAALMIWLLDVSPVWVILAAGVGGFIYGRIER